jgi:hypothetical protein
VRSTDTPSGRFYDTPAGRFPSVTTFLDQTIDKPQLDAWRERVGHAEADRISSEATERGELVHAFVERMYAATWTVTRHGPLRRSVPHPSG